MGGGTTLQSPGQHIRCHSRCWLSCLLQAFMACGEKADKGEIDMADCLKEVRGGQGRRQTHHTSSLAAAAWRCSAHGWLQLVCCALGPGPGLNLGRGVARNVGSGVVLQSVAGGRSSQTGSVKHKQVHSCHHASNPVVAAVCLSGPISRSKRAQQSCVFALFLT